MKDIEKLNALQDSFAVVICGIIKSDGIISDSERKKFDDFFAKEFELSVEEIDTLFESAVQSDNYDEHISLLKEGFLGHPMQMMQFMKFLNETILSDGIGENEYALFERVKDGLLV